MIKKIGILASGNGSNFQAIVDAILQGKLDAKISILISDNPQAYVLKRAQDFNIPTQVFIRKNYRDSKSFEDEMLKTLKDKSVDWVVLAGFMRILSPYFIQSYPNQILNIHPSLLPAFPGLNAIRQAFEAGVKVTGCTVHLVDEGCDTGPILAQREVEILSHDTLESLTEKIHQQEHQLYPEVLRKI